MSVQINESRCKYMENKSWKYPFGRFEDGLFDRNNDGKLDLWETAARDEYIETSDRIRKEKAEDNKYTGSSGYSYFSSNDENKKEVVVAEHQSLLLLFLAIIVLIGGMVMFFAVADSTLLGILVLLVAIVLGILFLKIGNWMR